MIEKPIFALVEDLFFAAKISGTARAVGSPVQLFQSPELILQELVTPDVSLVIVDLNARRYDPVEVISALKTASRTSSVRILGFYSHVQVDLARRAREAGCDELVTRSQFTKRLSEILSGSNPIPGSR